MSRHAAWGSLNGRGSGGFRGRVRMGKRERFGLFSGPSAMSRPAACWSGLFDGTDVGRWVIMRGDPADRVCVVLVELEGAGRVFSNGSELDCRGG